MNEKIQQIAQKWKYQPENINNGGFELALEEAYQSGRDAQRESDFNLCTHTYRHPMDLAKKIKNNT